MKSKKEVERTLEDCKADIPSYALSEEGGNYINQGWIEALEYVLGSYSEDKKPIKTEKEQSGHLSFPESIFEEICEYRNKED